METPDTFAIESLEQNGRTLQSKLDNFVTIKSPDTIASTEIINVFNRIASEFSEIDLTQHIRNISLSQKISGEIILNSIKGQPNCKFIEKELHDYFSRIDKMCTKPLFVKQENLFQENVSKEFEYLKKRLTQITGSEMIITPKCRLFSNSIQSSSVNNIPTGSGLEDEYGEFDIGSVDLENMTEELRKNMCRMKHFSHEGKERPSSYEINKNGKSIRRRISFASLKEAESWLVLSSELQGYMCLPCSLFFNGTNSLEGHYPRVEFCNLVKSPLKNFKNLTGTSGILTTHPETAYHKHAVGAYINMKNNNTLETCVKKVPKPKEVQANRDAIKRIIQTIYVFCSQNIALRGHDDAGRVENLAIS